MRPDSPIPEPPEERGGWFRRAFVRRPWHISALFLLLMITASRPFTKAQTTPPFG